MKKLLLIFAVLLALLPLSAAGLAHQYPDSVAVILQQCAHIPMIERPAETARHYRAFLGG